MLKRRGAAWEYTLFIFLPIPTHCMKNATLLGRLLLAFGLLAFGLPAAQGQVSIDPAYFTDSTPITITFDATQGSGGLATYPGDVYIYTGAVTNLSTSDTNWRYVVNSNYNTPVAAEKMTALGNHKYSISLTPRSYYPGFAASGETMQKLGMVFRAAGGSPEGKASGGANILLPLLAAPAAPVQALPSGAKADGITYLNNGTSAIVTLTAPNKDFVYLIGGFNSWQLQNKYLLKKTSTVDSDPATGRWWVQVDGLTPGVEYTYQFVVGKAGSTLKVADPYCEKILDPANDGAIAGVTPAYPSGQTGIVSVLQANAPAYNWVNTSFQRPARTNLVVYELHLRDFVGTHKYTTLTDTLKYLQRLGVNAIELLPISEFENNDSWGYNPSFYFAPDKFYGTATDLKRFIDACHGKGIAVVLDVVLNHSCDQSPMVQLYRDAGGPTPDNPWYNRVATHPLNVCNDFNHASQYTKYFTKNVIKFWLQNYHIDGYRFDLAKGFTQTNSGTADNATSQANWAAYDASRIAIWKDYYQTMVATDATLYPILEHFAAYQEETELANYGFMIWGNMNSYYNQATMGRSDAPWDLSYGYYGASYGGRGWNGPNLVTYLESHDEERLMYKNEQYGNTNSSGTYNIRTLATGLQRNELAAALFFTQPGPRMIWQFGEVGYDYSLNTCADGTTITPDCRTADKPIRWDYYQQANRRHLFDTYRALIALKKSQAAITSPTSYAQSLTGALKTITTTNGAQTIVAFGNVDVVSQTGTVLPSTGTWYNYLTGATVNAASTSMTLVPGQFGIYTKQRVGLPVGVTTLRVGTTLAAGTPAEAAQSGLSLVPNPASGTATVSYSLPSAATATITVQNLLGQTVRQLAPAQQAAGAHTQQLALQKLAAGVYLVKLRAGGQTQLARLVVE